jgi:hypothetical protein
MGLKNITRLAFNYVLKVQYGGHPNVFFFKGFFSPLRTQLHGHLIRP